MGKKCKRCGSKFPSTIKIDGKKRNLSNRTVCLTCVPFGHKFEKRTPGTVIEAECAKHGWTQFIIEKNGNRRCKRCRVDAVTQNRRNRKKKLVRLFGGKCSICGYDKCQEALQFHHVDPSEKSYGIAEKGHCLSWDTIVAEAKKCILVCANCHAEIENGITEIPH